VGGPWVELRVHGVSGTPPEEMLDIDRVHQVAGDEFGRFFRRADRSGDELHEPGSRILEAYHWGRLTSGSLVQGLWLLLAPFGLVNAAQFMLEPAETRPQRIAHHVAGAMLRLLGLTLTVLFVLAAAIITIDLWAWQREQATSGASFVLAMLGPLALLAVYRRLARTDTANNDPADDTDPATASAMPELPAGERRSDLVRPGFFEGDPGASALGGLHLAAGLTLVAVLGFAPGAQRPEPVGLLGFRLAVGLLAVIAALVTVLGDPQRSASTEWRAPDPGALWSRFQRASPLLARILVGVASGVLLLSAAYVWTGPPFSAPHQNLHYAGIDWASYSIMILAFTALGVLTLANGSLAWLRRNTAARRRRHFGPYAHGMACTLMAAIGVFLGVGYVGAFITTLATLMSTGDPGEQPPGQQVPGLQVEVPEMLARVVYAWGITAVGFIALGVVAVAQLLRHRAELNRFVDTDLGHVKGLRLPERWVDKIGTAVWVARLKNHVVAILAGFALVGALLTGVVAYELGPQLGPPATWPRLGPVPLQAPGELALLSASPTWPSATAGNATVLITALTALGTLTLTGLATALFFLGRTALFGESARRGVNVVWDVISFWPRSAHPFVPAAYSQRAVPDLEARIRFHLRRDPAVRLVLCGHSQGSLLSFATMLRLGATEPALLPRVGLLTFGSQLQVMFSRGFPAFVNHHAISGLYADLQGRWRNLYRDTDHLAGPVLSWGHREADPAALNWVDGGPPPRLPRWVADREQNGPDWRLVDPPVPAFPDLQRGVLLPLRRHSDYWLDPAWDEAVSEVRPG
jgi:hypothetical protein